MKTIKLLTLTLFAGSMAFTSCKKDTDENGNEPKTMKVRMTDSPGDYEKLEVEIASIEAYSDKRGWVMLESNSQMVSVLTLTNGAETTLVNETKIKSGTYTKLRFTFGSDNKVWINTEATLGGSFITTEFSLALSSPEKQYEVEIDNEVDGSLGANILVDFDVANSIKGELTGVLTLDPQMTVIKDEKTGIMGEVEGSENVAVMAEGNGETYSTYTNENGEFMMRGMVAGSYKITFMPTEDDVDDEEIEAFVVADGEIKSTGKVTLD